jgi:hypothetical protein
MYWIKLHFYQEHTKTYHDLFIKPETIVCMTRMVASDIDGEYTQLDFMEHPSKIVRERPQEIEKLCYALKMDKIAADVQMSSEILSDAHHLGFIRH